MAGLVLALQITADGSDLRSDIKLDEAALRSLGTSAVQVEAEARRAAAGLGAVETSTRQAALAALAYGNQTNMQAEAVNSYGDRIDGLRGKFTPFVAIQRQYLDTRNEINEAVKIGAINDIQAARALDLNRTGYERQLNSLRAATKATKEHTGAVKLQGYQLTNVFQQLQDVGVQLGSGQAIPIILLQQGPQLVSAMGGVKNSLALLAPYFTTTTVGMTALTAAVATGALAWNSYLNSVKAVETASAGRGRSLGIAPGDLEAIAAAGADAADISRKAAREAEVAFLSTGRIGAQTIRGLIAISRDYAATMNIDVSAAIEDLATKFADPAKGAQELQKQFDLLDDRGQRYVRTLIDQNRLDEARQVLLEALPSRLASAAEGATALGRAWHSVATGASDAWDWMGRALDRAVNGPEASEGALAALRKRAADLRAALPATQGAIIWPGEQHDRRELADIEAQIAAMEARLGKVRRDAATDRTNRISSEGGEIAFGLTPGARDLEALTQQQSKLKAILDDPATYAGKNNLDQVAASYDRVTHAIESYLTPAERARQQDVLAVQALRAKTPAEKAAVAEAQKRLELSGQSVTAAEREMQVTSAGTLARASATQQILDQNAALSLNTRSTLSVASAYLTSAEAAQLAAARRQALSEALQTGADVETQTRLHLAAAISATAEAGAQSVDAVNAQADAQSRLNDAMLSGRQTLAQASQQAQVDAALRQLIVARDAAEGEGKQVLTRVIDALTAAYARLAGAQARGAAADTISSQNDEIALLERQRDLIGQGAEARAVSTAMLQAEQQARRAGIELMTAEGRDILLNADYMARLTLEVERQQDAYDGLRNVGEGAFDALNDAIVDNTLSWDTLTDVVKDVQKEFLKLAAINPLKNALFGTNYGTLGDLGGFVGGLFGSFHGGGIVGRGSNDNRVLPVSALAGAPRFHSGGLVSGERVIIAKDDEEVVTADDPRHIRNINRAASAGATGTYGGGGAPIVSITNNVITPPGTRATTRTTDDGKGNVKLETLVEMVEDGLSERGRAGKGSLFPTIGSQFGLNAAAGRPRSAK